LTLTRPKSRREATKKNHQKGREGKGGGTVARPRERARDRGAGRQKVGPHFLGAAVQEEGKKGERIFLEEESRKRKKLRISDGREKERERGGRSSRRTEKKAPGREKKGNASSKRGEKGEKGRVLNFWRRREKRRGMAPEGSCPGLEFEGGKKRDSPGRGPRLRKRVVSPK